MIRAGEPSWVRAVLQRGHRGGEWRHGVDEERFDALLPLFRHGALDCDAPPVLDPALAATLSTMFQGGATDFMRDARNVGAGAPVMFRRGNVALRTANVLTGRFVPPPPERVPSALRLALVLTNRSLACERLPGSQTVALLVVATHVLLTIHPFPDGNGRVMRMFFVAKVRRHIGPSPAAILGLIVMQRYARGSHFHQAMWALRRGDAEPLVDLYFHATQLAATRVLTAGSTRLKPGAFLEQCWHSLAGVL